ncbi:MAG: chromosomal replication initiator protein DnaA [Oscillospiraceae bacterium]|nr:chromosomal replication initiator protein DnaA [Oscillospiraceae bacterium]
MYSNAYIWAKVIAYLDERLTPGIVSTFFDQSYILEINEQKLTVYAPSEFCKDFIERRCLGYIRDAVRELTNQDFDVDVICEEELESFQKSKERAGKPRFNPQFTFDSFVVGPSNRFAYNAALAVTDKPASAYNPLFIYGPSGLGKTHLLYAIANRIQQNYPDFNIVYISSEQFTNELIIALREHRNVEFRKKYRNADLLLMDDIQFIGGKASTEEEFFHTFNELFEGRKQIVVTSDRPPNEISLLADRLRTRFEGGLICDIIPPDYETRMAIIQNKANSLGMDLPDDICNYIAENITNNVRSLEGTVNIIKAYHELNGMPLDLSNVSRAIKDMYMDSGHNLPTPALIISEVSRYYSVEENLLRGRLKSNNIVMPRQIAMYLIREMTHQSYKNIGREFGRDHTTVISSLQKVEALIAKNDKETMDNLRDITANINSKL